MKQKLICLVLSMGCVIGSFEGAAAEEKDQTTKEKKVRMIHLPDPIMKLGDTGDRVRELQATLNRRLLAKQRDKHNGEPREVIPVRPDNLGGFSNFKIGKALPLKTASDKNRMRLVQFDNEQFQVRGDWIPYLSSEALFKGDDTKSAVFLEEFDSIQLPDEPLAPDGVYGQQTYAGVMLFQMIMNLPITGEVDPVTLDKLEPMVPTNPILATIMDWVLRDNFLNEKHDSHPWVIKTLTASIATLGIFLASLIVYQLARMLTGSTRFLSRWLFTPEKSPWFTVLREKHFFTQLAQFAPALFIYLMALVVFPKPMTVGDQENPIEHFPYLDVFQDWHVFLTRFGLAYAAWVFTQVVLVFIDACDEMLSPNHEAENPISGIIRASKRITALIGLILIVAALAGDSPWRIVGGLGAFMAIIMLVFRDYLLGIVASFQIITNKMVNVGDWIEMPKYCADGDVQEISLNVVKVQNFDKTVSMIPTHSLLNESFRNWNGMHIAGGRRIKRALYIDMNSIQICTPEMLEKFSKMELIKDYVAAKQNEIEAYNLHHDIQASSVNERRLTNIGTFRAYLEAYLKEHSELCDGLTFLVRHLQPTRYGLPLEIYAFSKQTNWVEYEAVQADIFDHVIAILPEFQLRAFQEVMDLEARLNA